MIPDKVLVAFDVSRPDQVRPYQTADHPTTITIPTGAGGGHFRPRTCFFFLKVKKKKHVLGLKWRLFFCARFAVGMVMVVRWLMLLLLLVLLLASATADAYIGITLSAADADADADATTAREH